MKITAVLQYTLEETFVASPSYPLFNTPLSLERGHNLRVLKGTCSFTFDGPEHPLCVMLKNDYFLHRTSRFVGERDIYTGRVIRIDQWWGEDEARVMTRFFLEEVELEREEAA